MSSTIGTYTRAKLNAIIDTRADTLDDQQLFEAAASDNLGNHTATQNLNLDNNSITNVLTGTFASITASGDVHIIGTLYGGSPLKIAGSLEIHDTENDGEVSARLGSSGAPNKFKGYVGFNMASDNLITHAITLPNTSVGNSGSMKAYSYETYSSLRFKENVHTIQNPMNKAMQLRGVTFDWKDTGRKDIGFIAEEVGKVIPEVVTYDASGENVESMSYQKLVSVLFECVKEQQTEITKIKEDLQILKDNQK